MRITREELERLYTTAIVERDALYAAEYEHETAYRKAKARVEKHQKLVEQLYGALSAYDQIAREDK